MSGQVSLLSSDIFPHSLVYYQRSWRGPEVVLDMLGKTGSVSTTQRHEREDLIAYSIIRVDLGNAPGRIGTSYTETSPFLASVI